MTIIQKIIKNLINKCIVELKKNENQKLIEQEFMYPIINYITYSINKQIYPYIVILFIIFFLILLIVIAILIILLFI